MVMKSVEIFCDCAYVLTSENSKLCKNSSDLHSNFGCQQTNSEFSCFANFPV